MKNASTILFHKTESKLLILAVTFIGLLSLMNNVYADIPAINTFVANDPDDADNVYSNGDTFTLTFSLPINVTASASMSKSAIDGNFTMSGGKTFGTTYSGLWSAARTTLTITVTNVAGASTPVISTTTISTAGTSNLGHAGDAPTSTRLTGSPTLSGDYGLFVALSSGGGCRGDCTAPTLGVNAESRRLVENGFTYNGKAVDVEYYFTPYPLITVNVGVENTAEFKIYDNMGAENIRHFQLAFGLANGQTMSTSKAMIDWDKSWDGKETVKVIDPENVLQNVRIDTSYGSCKEDSPDNGCLIVRIHHTFRAPLDFNIVGTNVWDEHRNSWQNYYNDGIEIMGESLNPPKQIQVLDEKGYSHIITSTGRDSAIDTDGNTWTFDKFWIREYIPIHDEDSATLHGVDRYNSMHQVYKNGQALLAEEVMKQILGGKLVQNEGFGINDEKPTAHNYVSRDNDSKLQKALIDEKIRASKLLEQLYTKEIRHK